MPPRKTRKRRTGRNVQSAIKRSLRGTRFNVPRSPPAINPCPWNQLTLAFTATSNSAKNVATCIRINDVFKAFAKQTGVRPELLSVRFKSVRFWEITHQALDVIIDETVDGSPCESYSDTLYQLLDLPGQATYACAGYRWPLSHRQQSKTLAEGTTVLFRIQLADKGKLYILLDLSWTSANLIAPPLSSLSSAIITLQHPRAGPSSQEDRPSSQEDLSSTEDLVMSLGDIDIAALQH